jgi:hypothetical protein
MPRGTAIGKSFGYPRMVSDWEPYQVAAAYAILTSAEPAANGKGSLKPIPRAREGPKTDAASRRRGASLVVVHPSLGHISPGDPTPSCAEQVTRRAKSEQMSPPGRPACGGDSTRVVVHHHGAAGMAGHSGSGPCWRCFAPRRPRYWPRIPWMSRGAPTLERCLSYHIADADGARLISTSPEGIRQWLCDGGSWLPGRYVIFQ